MLRAISVGVCVVMMLGTLPVLAWRLVAGKAQ
jgi:hypothetical protein